MRPAAVVVSGVGSKRPIEMAPTQDQRPVGALRPDRLDDSFGVGIGVGRTDRSADYSCSLRAKYFVERSDELGVPVADEEPDDGRPIIELHRQVAGLLGDPGCIWMRSRGTHKEAEYLPTVPDVS